MSAIDGVSSSAASATSGADATHLAGTQDEFLKLFMAQLQNQDPMSPKDGSDMVAQLAQFSSVEQQTQTNSQLAALAASQSSTANASLSSLVGRTCSASLGTVKVDDPMAIPPIETSSTGPINGASVVIKDASGTEIRRLPIPAGGGPVQWDGRDASGNLVKQGSYAMSVDSGTTTTAITANWQHAIDSIQLGASGSTLKMGGIEISPGAVTSIGATANTTDAITTALATGASTSQGSNS
ncbi:MAG: flagellar hook capping FlgD N-terminal domain-containing protein [Kofleriaceae bacterium]